MEVSSRPPLSPCPHHLAKEGWPQSSWSHLWARTGVGGTGTRESLSRRSSSRGRESRKARTQREASLKDMVGWWVGWWVGRLVAGWVGVWMDGCCDWLVGGWGEGVIDA